MKRTIIVQRYREVIRVEEVKKLKVQPYQPVKRWLDFDIEYVLLFLWSFLDNFDNIML